MDVIARLRELVTFAEGQQGVGLMTVPVEQVAMLLDVCEAARGHIAAVQHYRHIAGDPEVRGSTIANAQAHLRQTERTMDAALARLEAIE